MRQGGISAAGRVGLMVAPALLVFVLLTGPPEGLSVAGWRTAGVVGVMATLWITEAIPIPVTALLPLVFFPLLEVAPFRDVAAPFANPVIYLFLGGLCLPWVCSGGGCMSGWRSGLWGKPDRGLAGCWVG